MGKGDRKSRRGKIWRGSFGKRRPQKSKSGPPAAVVAAPAVERKGRTKKEAEPGE